MSELSKQELAALECVGKHFSGTWKVGKGSFDAHIDVAGKRTACCLATIQSSVAHHGALIKPRLRFDKVALRFVAALQVNLREVVPEGETLVVTITAPIRVASKTAAAAEALIRERGLNRSSKSEFAQVILGNHIRFGSIASGSTLAPKVVGYVHNPDSDPQILMDFTQSLLRCIATAASARPVRKKAGERWLVVAVQGGSSNIETYRQVYAQLAMSTGFAKILLVFDDGRIENLIEEA